MDCDICSVCHRHIDFAKLDAAYPHISESSGHFPPQEMSHLEEQIYWGTICADCARSAERNLVENLEVSRFPAKGGLSLVNLPTVQSTDQPTPN